MINEVIFTNDHECYRKVCQMVDETGFRIPGLTYKPSVIWDRAEGTIAFFDGSRIQIAEEGDLIRHNGFTCSVFQALNEEHL